jgi:pilus assembly protein Flp/PilA
VARTASGGFIIWTASVGGLASHRPLGRAIPRLLLTAIQRPFSFAVYSDSMKTIRRFLADESGATAIEYGLIAAGISLAIIAVVNGLGTKLNTKFTSINTSLQ